MNHIYRLIWNTALGGWTVASEHSRGRGKPARGRRTALAAVVLALAVPAVAAEPSLSDQGEEEESLQVVREQVVPLLAWPSLGVRAAGEPLAVHQQFALTSDSAYQNSVLSGDHSIVTGSRSTVSGGHGTAYGNQIIATGGQATGLGFGARAQGLGATALGSASTATAVDTIAVGRMSVASATDAVAIGYATSGGARAAVALGGYAKAYSEASVAVGRAAVAGASNGGTGSIAIGDYANAVAGADIAIGARSAVSSFHAAGNNASDFSAAIGSEAKVTGGRSLAVGNGAVVKGAQSSTDMRGTAIGNGSSVGAAGGTALGYAASATANGAVALGSGSIASAANTVSVGSASLKRTLVNVGDGLVAAGSAEAVTGNQLHATNQAVTDTAATARRLITEASAAGTVRLGIGNAGTRLDVRNEGNETRLLTGLKDGAVTKTSTEAVTGSQLYDTQALATGADTKATAARALAAEASTVANNAHAGAALANSLIRQASVSGDMRLGAQNSGRVLDVRNQGELTRSLSGVRDGTLAVNSSEAVTGGQLFATNTAVSKADEKAGAAQTAAAAATTAAGTAQAGADLANSLVRQVSASGDLRLGAQNTGRVVDVRNQGSLTRTLSGVREGTLAVNSSEAVTGGQLFATNTAVNKADEKAGAAQTAAAAATTAAGTAQAGADLANSLVRQVSASGDLRLGAQNTGRVVDVRNQGGLTRTLSGVRDGAIAVNSSEAVTGGQLFATNTAVNKADEKAGAAQTAAAAATTAAGTAQAGADLANSLVRQVSASGDLRLGAQNTGRVVDVRNQGSLTRTLSGVSDAALATDSSEAVTGRQLFATNEIARQQQVVVEDNARHIADNRGDIDSNQTGIGDNRTAIDGNRAAIGINGTSIDANRLNIGVNRDNIAALRSEFEDFAPDLDGVVTFNEDRSEVGLEGARIGGLAAGDVSSADSKEAVNGGQLFATNARVMYLEDQQRYLMVGSDESSQSARAGWGGIAIGDTAEAAIDGEGATAVGSFAKARGDNSVALGRAAHVHAGASGGFALGTQSQVAVQNGVSLGTSSEVRIGATNSIALGYRSIATEADTLSIGNDGATGLKRRIVNVGRGTKTDNATTVAQLNEVLAGLGGGAVMDAVGIVTRPEYVLSTNTYDNVGDALLALDTAIGVNQTDVDTLAGHVDSLLKEESSARSNAPGRLLLGGGHGMVLGNVADGRVAADSRDAVNGSQLHATNQKVGENRTEISDLRAALDVMQPHAGRNLMAAGEPVIDFGGARLAGVGAGDISSADSKDAVNGGQLFAATARIGGLESKQKFISIGADEASRAAAAGANGLAIGNAAEASIEQGGATAIGNYARARGRNSVALGRAAAVAGEASEGFALGVQSRVDAAGGIAAGAQAVVMKEATNSVALGYGSVASEANVISTGNDLQKRRIVNVANGTADHDAATVGQLKRIATVFGGSVDANGTPVSPSFNVQGSEYRTVGDALTALDTSVQDNEKSLYSLDRTLNRLFQEDPASRSDGPGRLNLGGTHGMVLGNVANGLIAAGSRDAVNGGQLYEVQKNLQGQIDTLEGRDNAPVAMMGRKGAPLALSSDAPTTTGDAPTTTSEVAPPTAPADTPVAKVDTPAPVVKAEGDTAVAVGSEGKERSVKHVAKGTADTDAVNVRQLNDVLERANEYTDVAVEGLNKRLDGMDKRFNRMAAMSSAQSAMAMNTAGLNTYNRLGAGVGHSDGESALAVGYQRVMNERGSATFSLNGAFTNSGERTVGVGVGIGW
jgi:autotransporter adhesin